MTMIHEMLLNKKFEKIMQYPLIKFPPFSCGNVFFLNYFYYAFITKHVQKNTISETLKWS
jgi:hypothetical protein